MSMAPGLRRVRVLGAVVIAAVFLAGALAGAAVEHLRTVRQPPPATIQRVIMPDVIENMKMAGTGIPVMYEALDLTPEQREQIRQIIGAHRSKTDSLLRDRWTPLRAVIDSVRRQVDQVLTAEQRAKLAAMRLGGL